MPVNRRRFLALAMGFPAVASASVTAPASPPPVSDIVATILSHAATPRHSNELWVLIDDKEAVLSIFRGNTLIERFAPISLGTGGARTQRVRGDSTTPLGEFRVYRFNRQSKWHIFIGIDYPTPPHARMALETGIYSQADYEAYFDEYRRYGFPPQDTALGGAIGIHGIGTSDPEIHGRYHWTQGCIAVNNQQIERIASLVDVGTRVVIR
ncbi:murein L,D-transpeptidase family protein [Halomonas sp. HNIBRBA4712]|uniref:L,D-transpeptidase family protein n=1 Tax=Halomonas sp. HNIBRBA4712 TaxID=3373087 RepID=UPI003745DD1C